MTASRITLGETVALGLALAHVRAEKRKHAALTEEWTRLDDEEQALARSYRETLEAYADAFVEAHKMIIDQGRKG